MDFRSSSNRRKERGKFVLIYRGIKRLEGKIVDRVTLN
jgi:hypothetical protein